MSDRQRGPVQRYRTAALGEYELEGGSFGPPAGAVRSRGDQRNIAERPSERALTRPGSLWRAVLRRIRTA